MTTAPDPKMAHGELLKTAQLAKLAEQLLRSRKSAKSAKISDFGRQNLRFCPKISIFENLRKQIFKNKT